MPSRAVHRSIIGLVVIHEYYMICHLCNGSRLSTKHVFFILDASRNDLSNDTNNQVRVYLIGIFVKFRTCKLCVVRFLVDSYLKLLC